MIKTADYKSICRVLVRLMFRVMAALCRGKIPDIKAETATVVYRFLDSGHLNIAECAARQLHALFPTLPFARNLCEIFDRMPAVEAARPAFRDDRTKDVQIVADDSEIVVLLFCGTGHSLGLPLSVIHRWLARLPASLVYLRDFERDYFLGGVRSLGPSRGATLAELRRIVASLHGRRIVCFGQSAGVFAALDFGLELGAEAILCMGGATNLSVEFNVHTRREKKSLALRSQFPDARLDMRDAYANVARPPRVCIVYGQNNWDDRDQAKHLGMLPCVTLCGLDNFSEHNVIIDVIIREKFEGLLDWLVRNPVETPFVSPRADNQMRDVDDRSDWQARRAANR